MPWIVCRVWTWTHITTLSHQKIHNDVVRCDCGSGTGCASYCTLLIRGGGAPEWCMNVLNEITNSLFNYRHFHHRHPHSTRPSHLHRQQQTTFASLRMKYHRHIAERQAWAFRELWREGGKHKKWNVFTRSTAILCVHMNSEEVNVENHIISTHHRNFFISIFLPQFPSHEEKKCVF